MDSNQISSTHPLTDITGLWSSGLFAKGNEPSIRSLREWTKLRRIPYVTHDVLRHTFISMYVGKFRSVADAALQAGNSEEIIRRHYLDLKSQAEAARFFAIVPCGLGVDASGADEIGIASPS